MEVLHRLAGLTLVFAVAACAAPDRPAEPAKPEYRTDIIITTGVHGNEPSGYLVQDKLKAMGFTVFGPCNPWGIANNNRHMEDGRDLNRCFALKDCPEAEAVREFLRNNRPALLLDLHEDPDGTHPYLIQNGPADDIGARIIEALKHEYEFDPKPAWSFIEGENGLIKPTREQLALQKISRVYSLGYYAWLTYGCTSFTVECPGSWPEERRKAYCVRVCETAREIFSARD